MTISFRLGLFFSAATFVFAAIPLRAQNAACSSVPDYAKLKNELSQVVREGQKGHAMATGNLFASAQPGQSLYGIANSSPDPVVAFAGPAADYGQSNDPMVGKPIGGVIVFGGGLPLYTAQGALVGGLGVSGDTSCSDHVVAWKVRHDLHFDGVPMGPGPSQTDNLVFDIQNGVSQSGFGHPECKGGLPSKDIIEALNKNYPTGPRHLHE